LQANQFITLLLHSYVKHGSETSKALMETFTEKPTIFFAYG
jgi:hypothetical protein